MLRIKTVFCGNTSVGKTTILTRFATNSYDPKTLPTVAGVFRKTFVQKKNQVYDLEIWDTAGDERYSSVIPSFFKRAGVVVIVFDISQRQTFDNLDYWKNFVAEHAPENTPLIIAGNKVDLDDQRVVTCDEAMKYTKSIQALGYIETSAKTGEGMTELFSLISTVPPNEIITNPNIVARDPISLDKKGCCK